MNVSHLLRYELVIEDVEAESRAAAAKLRECLIGFFPVGTLVTAVLSHRQICRTDAKVIGHNDDGVLVLELTKVRPGRHATIRRVHWSKVQKIP